MKQNYNHKFVLFSIEFDNRHIHRRINLKQKSQKWKRKMTIQKLNFFVYSSLVPFFFVWMSFLQCLFIRFSFQFVLAIVINYYSFTAEQKKASFISILSLTSPLFLCIECNSIYLMRLQKKRNLFVFIPLKKYNKYKHNTHKIKVD